MVKIVKGIKLVENLEMDIVTGGFESLEVWKEGIFEE